jgi:ABC-type uncharacterized transport system substrate-binding protein
MRRRDFLTLAGAAAALPRVGLAQQPVKMPLIVVLSNGLAEERKQAILQGLRDYGYVDGKTVVIEWLTAASIADVPAFAAQAVTRKPDIIITAQSPAPLALKELATDIPVVFSGLEDPVAIGVVPNYGRPGGNMTGYMFGGPDVAGKRMQILSEALPGISSLALIGLPADPTYPVILSQTRTAMDAFGIEPILFDVKEGVDFVALFESVNRGPARQPSLGSNHRPAPVLGSSDQ